MSSNSAGENEKRNLLERIPGWLWGALGTVALTIITYSVQRLIDTNFSKTKTEIEESIKSELGRKNIAYQAITNNAVMVRNTKIEQYYIALSGFEQRFIEPMILFNCLENIRKPVSQPQKPVKKYIWTDDFQSYDDSLTKLNKQLKLLSLYVSDSTTGIIRTYCKEARTLSLICDALISRIEQERTTTNGAIVEIEYGNFSSTELLKQIEESDKTPKYSEPDDVGYSDQINNPIYIKHKQLESKYEAVIGALRKELTTPVEIIR